jgi:hypothetical protein
MKRCCVALLAMGCVASARPPDNLTAQDTIPVGYGSLRRDDIVVKFQTDQVELQFLPLNEHVIRLLAPDTYKSLEQLLRSRRAGVDSAAQRAGVANPTLAMVTFYGLLPEARFTPEDVNVTSRGRLFRPIGIVPLSPTWSSQQLDAREQAVAIYLFDEGISFRDALTVSYQTQSNDSWSRAVSALDRERARVLARAASKPGP